MQPEAIRLAVYAAAFVAELTRVRNSGLGIDDGTLIACHEDAEATADFAIEAAKLSEAARGEAK